RCVERALRDAGGLCSDADAAAVESGERYLVALALFADAIRNRPFAIREDELRASRRMNAELLLFLADSKSRRAFFHHERRDSLLALLALRVHIRDHGIGRAAIRDPSLRAVDHVAIAFADGFRLER